MHTYLEIWLLLQHFISYFNSVISKKKKKRLVWHIPEICLGKTTFERTYGPLLEISWIKSIWLKCNCDEELCIMWIIMNPIVIDSDKNMSLFCWLLLLQPLCSTPHPLPSVFDEKPHTHLSIQFAWKNFLFF